MVYTPTVFVNNSAPAISKDELNKIGDGIKYVDAGVHYTPDPNFYDAPNTYAGQMVHISRGLASAPWNFPNWSSVLTIGADAGNNSYTSQLFFGATSDDIRWRRSVNGAGSAWGNLYQILHEGIPNAFVMPQDFRFGQNKVIIWNQTFTGDRIFLNPSGSSRIGVEGTEGQTYITAQDAITFYKHAVGGSWLRINFALNLPAMLTWTNELGVRERYWSPGYERGIQNNTLYDMTDKYWSLFLNGQNPAVDQPRLVFDASVGNPTSGQLVSGGTLIPRMASGQYSGDDVAQHRVINIGFTPRYVKIIRIPSNLNDNTNPQAAEMMGGPVPSPYDKLVGHSAVYYDQSAERIITPLSINYWHVCITTNGFKIGGPSSVGLPRAMNIAGYGYTWIAYG